MSSHSNKLWGYVKNYAVSEKTFSDCLVEIAMTKGISTEKVAEKILEETQRQKDKCISRSEIVGGKKLKDYQSLAVDHMLSNRGMIAAFSVGTGKTLTAVAVAGCILRFSNLMGKKIKVIVITPTSLQDNFKNEMRGYGLDENDKYYDRFHFYTPSTFQLQYKLALFHRSSMVHEKFADKYAKLYAEFMHKYSNDATYKKEYDDAAKHGPSSIAKMLDQTSSKFITKVKKEYNSSHTSKIKETATTISKLMVPLYSHFIFYIAKKGKPAKKAAYAAFVTHYIQNGVPPELLRMINRRKLENLLVKYTPLKNTKKQLENFLKVLNQKRKDVYPSTFRTEYVDCGNSLLIVDEAHNFRKDFDQTFAARSYGDGPAHTQAELILKCASKAWKVLLLTATPIYNATYDLANLIEMVDGRAPGISGFDRRPDPYDLLSESPAKFRDIYKDKILFQDSNKTDFPSRQDIVYEILMSGEWLREYYTIEKRARSRKSKANKADDDIRVTNSFMVAMRKASNDLENAKKTDVAMTIVNGALSKNEGLIFFSEFKSSGVQLFINRLKRDNIPYHLIDGGTTMQKRQELVSDFNNGNGKVFIITKAGGEGLDFKAVRHVILFEKGWNLSGMEQVIGRAIRYKSHSHLPVTKRKVIIHHLLSVKPTDYISNTNGSYTLKMNDVNIFGDKHIRSKNAEIKRAVEKQALIYGVMGKLYWEMSADIYMFNTGIEKDKKAQTVIKALKTVQIGKN